MLMRSRVQVTLSSFFCFCGESMYREGCTSI
nr:MAG TPA: hypothetical protein [Caudoviricetes sp.]